MTEIEESPYPFYVQSIDQAFTDYESSKFPQIKQAAKVYLMGLLIGFVGDDSLTGKQRLKLLDKFVSYITDKNNKGDN